MLNIMLLWIRLTFILISYYWYFMAKFHLRFKNDTHKNTYLLKVSKSEITSSRYLFLCHQIYYFSCLTWSSSIGAPWVFGDCHQCPHCKWKVNDSDYILFSWRSYFFYLKNPLCFDWLRIVNLELHKAAIHCFFNLNLPHSLPASVAYPSFCVFILFTAFLFHYSHDTE